MQEEKSEAATKEEGDVDGLEHHTVVGGDGDFEEAQVGGTIGITGG